MQPVELLGWTANIIFAVCALPQAVHSYKVGNSNGLTAGTLTLWFSGEFLSILYGGLTNVADPIMFNYVFNFACLSVIVRYKVFPRWDK